MSTTSFPKRRVSLLDTQSAALQHISGLPKIVAQHQSQSNAYGIHHNVQVDPSLNFINPARRKKSLPNSQIIQPKLNALNTASSAQMVLTNSVLNQPDESPVFMAQKLQSYLKEEHINYQTLPNMFSRNQEMNATQPTFRTRFNETISKLSIAPSILNRLSPSVLSTNNGSDPHNKINRLLRQQHTRIDDKELEINNQIGNTQDVKQQQLLYEELYEFYRRILSDMSLQMTEENSQSIQEFSSLFARLNRSIKTCIDRERTMFQRLLNFVNSDIIRYQNDLAKVEAELLDFKENKTLEAYFKKFRTIPNREDRIQLIARMEEFLGADSTFKNLNKSYASDTASEVVSLLEIINMELSEKQLGIFREIPNNDDEQGHMAEIMTGIKKLMIQEAYDVRSLSEQTYKQKMRLNQGKLPLKTTGTESLSWLALTNDFTTKIEQLTKQIKLHDHQFQEKIKFMQQEIEIKTFELKGANEFIKVLQSEVRDYSMMKHLKHSNEVINKILTEQFGAESAASVMAQLEKLSSLFQEDQEKKMLQLNDIRNSLQQQANNGLFKLRGVHQNQEDGDEHPYLTMVEKKKRLENSALQNSVRTSKKQQIEEQKSFEFSDEEVIQQKIQTKAPASKSDQTKTEPATPKIKQINQQKNDLKPQVSQNSQPTDIVQSQIQEAVKQVKEEAKTELQAYKEQAAVKQKAAIENSLELKNKLHAKELKVISDKMELQSKTIGFDEKGTCKQCGKSKIASKDPEEKKNQQKKSVSVEVQTGDLNWVQTLPHTPLDETEEFIVKVQAKKKESEKNLEDNKIDEKKQKTNKLDKTSTSPKNQKLKIADKKQEIYKLPEKQTTQTLVTKLTPTKAILNHEDQVNPTVSEIPKINKKSEAKEQKSVTFKTIQRQQPITQKIKIETDPSVIQQESRLSVVTEEIRSPLFKNSTKSALKLEIIQEKQVSIREQDQIQMSDQALIKQEKPNTEQQINNNGGVSKAQSQIEIRVDFGLLSPKNNDWKNYEQSSELAPLVARLNKENQIQMIYKEKQGVINEETQTDAQFDDLAKFDFILGQIEEVIQTIMKEQDLKENIPQTKTLLDTYMTAIPKVRSAMQQEQPLLISSFQKNLSPQIKNTSTQHSIPQLDAFEKYGHHTIELNKEIKERIVNIKTVGRIGGGFIGHIAK